MHDGREHKKAARKFVIFPAKFPKFLGHVSQNQSSAKIPAHTKMELLTESHLLNPHLH